MMSKPSNTGMRARALAAHLREQRARLLQEQLTLLQAAFPEVVADARSFVEGTGALPWGFGVAMLDDDVYTPLQRKYNVQCSRHRPPLASVPALTNLFFDACELIHAQIVSAADAGAELL